MNDWKDITQDIKRLTKIQDVIFKKLKETQDTPEIYLKYVDAFLELENTLKQLKGIKQEYHLEEGKDGYNV